MSNAAPHPSTTETSQSVGAAGKIRVESRRNAFRLFGYMEQAIAVGIGTLLSLAAVLALAGAVTLAWDNVTQWPKIRGLVEIIDRLLFVLMIVEILHTVRASIQARELTTEPFLIVAMIATIRRILVVTLETSEAQGGTGPAAFPFEHAMIELGILGVLTLILALAIHLSRRNNA
jgi:uncharacterized membrane protein (DUF373 family)